MYVFLSVEVPDLYPWVLLQVGVISFQCIVIGFGAGAKRKEFFDGSVKVKDKYNEQHKATYIRDIPKGGYPDMGDGRFGQELTYKQWRAFQLDQRGHKNFLEQVAMIVFFQLVIGFMWPVVALVFGFIHFVCRFIFVYGYKYGPKWRMLGGMPINILVMVSCVLSLVATSLLTYEVFEAL